MNGRILRLCVVLLCLTLVLALGLPALLAWVTHDLSPLTAWIGAIPSLAALIWIGLWDRDRRKAGEKWKH